MTHENLQIAIETAFSKAVWSCSLDNVGGNGPTQLDEDEVRQNVIYLFSTPGDAVDAWKLREIERGSIEADDDESKINCELIHYVDSDGDDCWAVVGSGGVQTTLAGARDAESWWEEEYDQSSN